MTIENRLTELLRERGFECSIARGAEGFWLIDYKDEAGNSYCITPTSLISDQWWLTEMKDDSPTLKSFLRDIDRLMMADYGTTHRDIDDYNWEDEFNSEVEPADAYEEWKIHTEGGTRSSGNF